MSENINETCVGPASEQAGKASSCAGCPNQSNCSSGAAKQQVDIDAEQVNDRMALIKNKILVLSGKGGVGKSTVSAQLAFSLSLKGFQVGLLDIDICGPSIPRMLGLSGQEVHQSSCGWSPVYVSDTLGVMSIGFMLPNPDDAIIWRGPRKNGLIKQFLCDVDWGKLDYLIIDTPPGTSDEHISIVQHLVAAGRSGLGAVVVTTPQEVAMADVRKELNFCKKTGLPVYGIVENMSEILVPLSDKNLRFLDPESGADATAEVMHKLESVYPELARYLVQFPMLALCDSSTNATYGEKPLSGPARMAQAFDTKHLGTIPMDSALLACGERGQGLLESFPTSLVAKHLSHIIDQIIQICITDIPDAANADKMN